MLVRLITPLFHSDKKSILLLGPRQVGKSTLCKGLKPDLTISLASEAALYDYKRDLRLLERQVKNLTKPSLIVIDEIQRAPELLNTVQYLIDQLPINHRYILTGSSARKLKRGSANLLPGRVIERRLTPLMWGELGKNFDIARALKVGMLPGIYLDTDSANEVLSTYADTYLREEIQAEGIIRNIGGFARLIDVVANVSGQWLNYSKISSDCEINKESVRAYISILEDTLLLQRIPAFSTKALTKNRKVTQRDKIVLFDIGVRNALLKIHNSNLSPTEFGICFEQWCIQQVLAFKSTMKRDWNVTSFLDRNGNEVDLIIDTGKDLFVIEIKSGSKFRKEWINGILSFRELVKTKDIKSRIWYMGDIAQKLDDGTQMLPFIDGLNELIS